jgi:3-(3-hydroxy-phenyl)propionate hydroxylase
MTAAGQEVPDTQTDVLVVGAGTVGLTLANILGLQGIRTVVVEERDTLIDYPRGVGLDDEALRTFQSIGLADRVLPHTVPNQILRFMDAKRRVLAEMAPPDARFGWPKRNGFVQPLVDAELLAGLDRFEHVQVRWASPMATCREDADGVTVELGGGTENNGDTTRLRALCGRLRRRPQHDPPGDGCVVRRDHLVDAVAGGRHRQ